MRLHIERADARDIAADVQFVKHFDGLIGGAERALDDAIGGKIRELLNALESEPFGMSRIIKVPSGAPVKAKHLVVVGLGAIERFSTQNLQAALVHAMGESLAHGFSTIATPVVGISQHVGLPLESAYPVCLYSVLTVLLEHRREKGQCPVTDVTIFDDNAETVSALSARTPGVLESIGVPFRRFSDRSFIIELSGGESGNERLVAPRAETTTEESEEQAARRNVFISHSSKDKWFANEIYNALGHSRVRAFLDERDIEYGQPIDEVLVQGLRQCDTVVLVISPESATSDWVKYEIGAAWALDKHIVPVRLGTAPTPVVAQRLKYVDATQNQLEAVRQLVEHLQKRFGEV